MDFHYTRLSWQSDKITISFLVSFSSRFHSRLAFCRIRNVVRRDDASYAFQNGFTARNTILLWCACAMPDDGISVFPRCEHVHTHSLDIPTYHSICVARAHSRIRSKKNCFASIVLLISFCEAHSHRVNNNSNSNSKKKNELYIFMAKNWEVFRSLHDLDSLHSAHVINGTSFAPSGTHANWKKDVLVWKSVR